MAAALKYAEARLAALNVVAQPGPVAQQVPRLCTREHARADHIGHRELITEEPLMLAERRLERGGALRESIARR